MRWSIWRFRWIREAAAISNFGEGEDSDIAMIREKPRHTEKKVWIEWVTVIIETGDEVCLGLPEQLIARINGAARRFIFNENAARKFLSHHLAGPIRAAVRANQNLIGQRS